MPDSVDMAVTLAVADPAKFTSEMKRHTRNIPGDHLCLQCPVSRFFRCGNQTEEQCTAYTTLLRTGGDVDADLSDTGRASCIWNCRQGRPCDDAACGIACDETSCLQVSAIPGFPLRDRPGECGNACTQPFAVDPAHLRPVVLPKRFNGEIQVLALCTSSLSAPGSYCVCFLRAGRSGPRNPDSRLSTSSALMGASPHRSSSHETTPP